MVYSGIRVYSAPKIHCIRFYTRVYYLVYEYDRVYSAPGRKSVFFHRYAKKRLDFGARSSMADDAAPSIFDALHITVMGKSSMVCSESIVKVGEVSLGVIIVPTVELDCLMLDASFLDVSDQVC